MPVMTSFVKNNKISACENSGEGLFIKDLAIVVNATNEKIQYVNSTDLSVSPSGSSIILYQKQLSENNYDTTLAEPVAPQVSHGPSPSVSGDFLIPISRLPARNYLTFGYFASSMEYLGEGSNSTVHLAKYNNANVVVKVPKKDSPTALQDLHAEIIMLSRVKHLNIINMIGAGESPTEFIVLEYLGGGTLKSLLYNKSCYSQLTQAIAALFSASKNNKLKQILHMGKDIASALHYLHELFHSEACIIHRDLKPDNIGFTEDMKLKLFDFGLMACVRRPALVSDLYQMSGYTGSPRYMAPEVALCEPYNQKVDVYSFGILFWEMLTGKVPFEGFGVEELMQKAVREDRRPAIPKSLRRELSDLLTACWEKEPAARPSFSMVLTALEAELAAAESS